MTFSSLRLKNKTKLYPKMIRHNLKTSSIIRNKNYTVTVLSTVVLEDEK